MSYLSGLIRLVARPWLAGLAVMLVGASVIPPVSLAQSDAKGIEQKTKYYTGFWRKGPSGDEATWVVLVNGEGWGGHKSNDPAPDPGDVVEALVFVFGEEENALACGWVVLSAGDIARVDISQLPQVQDDVPSGAIRFVIRPSTSCSKRVTVPLASRWAVVSPRALRVQLQEPRSMSTAETFMPRAL